MTTTKITGTIGTTDGSAELGAEIWSDQTLVLDVPHITADVQFSYEIDDNDNCKHSLKIVLKNKLPVHTQIDSQGNILQDARLTVQNIAFDEIELGQVFIDKAVYTHNFNGTQDEVQDRFYGEMGCNGTVQLDFTTPIYLWLLENM